ncbi:MAG: uncharacterized protein PWQ17_1820 [Anaerophaga sp.]|nr:uncharacterized protein [Anaerophaga sp.]
MYIRKQIFEKSGKESFFLWGARQTGKSTLLKNMYPESLWFDLLQTDVFERLYREPSQLREIVMASDHELPLRSNQRIMPERDTLKDCGISKRSIM